MLWRGSGIRLAVDQRPACQVPLAQRSDPSQWSSTSASEAEIVPPARVKRRHHSRQRVYGTGWNEPSADTKSPARPTPGRLGLWRAGIVHTAPLIPKSGTSLDLQCIIVSPASVTTAEAALCGCPPKSASTLRCSSPVPAMRGASLRLQQGG